MTASIEAPIYAYIGTFTRMPPHPRGGAEGIHVCRLDSATGAFTLLQEVTGVDSPSFVALHPNGGFLYAVNAVPEHDGRPGGSVSAFAIDPATGHLTPLNRQPAHGAGPCHVSVDPSGRWALAASYGSGSVVVLPIRSDGSLGPASDVVQHAGASVHERQQGPHAHSLTLDPAGRFALVCDLGLDQVLVYRLDAERGRLIANEPPCARTAPGAGPRHLDFHPTGRFVYVLGEITSTLTAYAYDGAAGTLRELQSLSTLPAGWSGQNSTADVHVHPNGRFVYASNRGHDSLAIFAIDPAAGTLSPLGHESTRGRTPRNFAIDRGGAFLFAANQDSDTIVTFALDGETGRLAPAGPVIELATPVCIRLRYP
jgi:6-phosphogluconolactonase